MVHLYRGSGAALPRDLWTGQTGFSASTRVLALEWVLLFQGDSNSSASVRLVREPLLQ